MEDITLCLVLAVGRRKDSMLRKILAQVPGDYLLRDPEEILPQRLLELGMLGGTALGRIEARHGVEVHWGSSDCTQAFTSCELPAAVGPARGAGSACVAAQPASVAIRSAH